MSLAILPSKSPRPRTVEEILGPKACQELIGLDLQFREDSTEGNAKVSIHYDRVGASKVFVEALRVHHVVRER